MQGLAQQSAQPVQSGSSEMIKKVIELLQNGVSPEELISKGVPPEIVQEAMNILNSQQMPQQQGADMGPVGLAQQQVGLAQ